MTQAFFEGVERVRYEGAQTQSPLAFRFYDADRVVLGRRMERIGRMVRPGSAGRRGMEVR